MNNDENCAKKEIHLVCNAHLDPVWQWGWEEGAAAAVATFRSAADLLEHYDYVFCHNEALLYEWIEEYDPDLFERIKKFVKEGKWHIMGGWYLQPDCNMPSGESLIRQALVGRAYFAEKFGAEYLPETAVNFDPFGHSWGLPQILAKCGYKNYLFMRPLPDDKQGTPAGDFIWRGVDGTEVKAAYSGFYASALGRLQEKLEIELKTFEIGEDARVLNGGNLMLSCWGVGNHGGGPSAKDLEYVTQKIKSEKNVSIIHSTPDLFFSRVSPTQVYDKSLNNCMPGCYTSIIRIKQNHRKLENKLYTAEKMLSVAALNGLIEYPENELKEVERDLLFCEFHDILPGSCIQLAENAVLERLAHGISIADKLKTRAFFALSAGLPKPKDGEYPILVYNHHPYPIKMPVRCGLMLADQQWDGSFWTGFEVYDGEKKIPSQMIREKSSINLDWAKHVMFECEMPPCSMKVFYAKPCTMEKFAVRPLPQNYVYTDNYKTVAFNSQTGFIESIIVKGKSFVKKDSFVPTVYSDNADAWAMADEQRVKLGKKVARFRLMNSKECSEFLNSEIAVSPLRIVEGDNVCQVVEGFYKYGSSTIVMRYTLYKSLPDIDIDLRVLWNESDKMLKLNIPAAFKGEYLGQIAYGIEVLSQTGSECVSQQWVSYKDSDKAFAIINDGVYGSSCENNEVGITLLRSAVYAAHPIQDRPIIPCDRFSDRMDNGERFYHFKFVAGDTNDIVSTLNRKAQIFNEEPFVLNCTPNGQKRKVNSVLSLSDEIITLNAFKRSIDKEGYIVRLFNNTNSLRESVLTVSAPLLSCEKKIPLAFKPYEFKTVKITKQELKILDYAEI